MKIYYAKSSNGFYSQAINGDNIPIDAIEITEDLHSALLDEQSKGKIIGTNSKGYPVIQNSPAPTDLQLWASYQDAAKFALSKSDITLLRILENTQVVPSLWLIYRKSLRIIITAKSGDSTIPLPSIPAYPAGT
jgi:hypothetical protein